MSENMAILNISPVDSEQNFESFIQSFITVFDKHAPMKTKRVKQETQSKWHNENIKAASKQRDMYHKTRNWSQYKYWRNKKTEVDKKAMIRNR